MTRFADGAAVFDAPILEHETIARQTKRVRLQVPAAALESVPGQFFMLRNPAGNDPLIGRAFAVYDVGENGESWLDLVYVVKGKFTTSIADFQPGNMLTAWGPLGNGFATTTTDHLIMVAGGIGQTPFLALAKEALGQQSFGPATDRRPNGYAKRVSLCYGVRSAEYLAGLDAFERAGCEIVIASEDGSLPEGRQGTAGRVTTPLEDLLAKETGHCRIVCCGPEPMMEAVASIAARANVECQVSLETPMACGIGICFSCVAKVGEPKDWDFKRTCVEGPVFDANQIVWHA